MTGPVTSTAHRRRVQAGRRRGERGGDRWEHVRAAVAPGMLRHTTFSWPTTTTTGCWSSARPERRSARSTCPGNWAPVRRRSRPHARALRRRQLRSAVCPGLHGHDGRAPGAHASACPQVHEPAPQAV